jgi:DNA-binding CsgD family transcriptional regulator
LSEAAKTAGASPAYGAAVGPVPAPAPLAAALGVYERIALAGMRNPAHLDWLTLLPSSQVREQLDVLVEVGLVRVLEASDGASATVELPPLETLGGLALDDATRERLAGLRGYWLAHAPHEAGVLHGSPGFWTQWWLILARHHSWPAEQPIPRDRPLGAPSAGPLLMDLVMPDLPGFYRREWVENLDRGIMARLAADDWLRLRLIVPAATADNLAADLVDLVRAHGFEVRVLDVPQWFAVYRGSGGARGAGDAAAGAAADAAPDGTGVAVVPEAAHDAFDGFIARVEQPLAVWGLARLFEMLWSQAAPWRAHAPASASVFGGVALGAALGRREKTSGRASEVLELLAQGMPDEQIAVRLGITDRTVRRHVATAMEHAGVTTRFQLGSWWAARA